MKYKIAGDITNTSALSTEIESAIKEFFDICSVKEIESACNNKRVKLLSDWTSKPKEEPIEDLGISNITYAIGIKEISEPYSLIEPENIEIIFSDGESQVNDGKAAMEINTHTNQIYVYKKCFSLKNGEYYWDNMSIKDVTYHELLHACGDIQHDGIIRHNLIGVNVVKELIVDKYER